MAIPVDSTNLQGIEYNITELRLVITFSRGDVYEYDGVAPTVVAGLLTAGSHGAYFNDNIKGQYAYRRITRVRSMGRTKDRILQGF
jgi:hypothetical protein